MTDRQTLCLDGWTYMRFDRVWMVQPPMLRGFVRVERHAEALLDEIERLRAQIDHLSAELAERERAAQARQAELDKARQAELIRARRPPRVCPSCGEQCQPSRCINVPA